MRRPADASSWSLVASLAASSSALRRATIAVAPTITTSSAMNGAKRRLDRQAFVRRARVTLRVATTCFPDPIGAPKRTLSDVSGYFCPEPSELSRQRQGDQKGRGGQEPGHGQREEERGRDLLIGDHGGELTRANVPPHRRVEQHDERDEHTVAPRSRHGGSLDSDR